jgi:gas vesicle protein
MKFACGKLHPVRRRRTGSGYSGIMVKPLGFTPPPKAGRGRMYNRNGEEGEEGRRRIYHGPNGPTRTCCFNSMLLSVRANRRFVVVPTSSTSLTLWLINLSWRISSPIRLWADRIVILCEQMPAWGGLCGKNSSILQEVIVKNCKRILLGLIITGLTCGIPASLFAQKSSEELLHEQNRRQEQIRAEQYLREQQRKEQQRKFEEQQERQRQQAAENARKMQEQRERQQEALRRQQEQNKNR